jgi:hypothetical protein
MSSESGWNLRREAEERHVRSRSTIAWITAEQDGLSFERIRRLSSYIDHFRVIEGF